jgi:hypothetical protein
MAPHVVGAQNQLGVCSAGNPVMAARFEFRDERWPIVHAAITDNPSLLVQTQRLVFIFRFRTNIEERMAEPHMASDPNVLSVGTAESLKIY